MKEFIVTRGFNNVDIIGKLQLVHGVEIPFGSVFALGGIVKRKHVDENGKDVVDEFELMEVSLIADTNYKPAKDNVL